MAIARSRIRQKQKQKQKGEQAAAAERKPRNPYVVLVMLVALVGVVLVIGAFVYYMIERRKRAEQVKIIRGMTLLDQLDDIACDYYYTGKDKKNDGHLPDAAWAPFKEHAKAGDLFDAVITVSEGAKDPTADACFYKEGKAAGGEALRVTMGRPRYEGKPGPQPNPKRAQVQIVNGSVVIGTKSKRVIFFRRPILHPLHGTKMWFGQAVIILYRDVDSPEPENLEPPEVKPLPEPEKKKDPEKKAEPKAENAKKD